MKASTTTMPLPPAELQQVLAAAFPGSKVSVRDDTHLHEDHNQDVNHLGGHYKVKIVWEGFAALSRVARQRAVYQAVHAAWAAGRIHALTLQLLTPSEAATPR